MKGFFGIGVERSSKWLNAGNLLRTTHAFGGSFFFFIDPELDFKSITVADTAGSSTSLPVYHYQQPSELMLPRNCKLVGVELTEDAIELPRFYHPAQAAYVLGPEKGSLSPELQARCDHMVKIPMKFCVNVGVAGAILMYDRLLTTSHYPPRQMDFGRDPMHIDMNQEFPDVTERFNRD